LNLSTRNLGPAPSKRNAHKFLLKVTAKACIDDDDEWVKGKPVLVGKVSARQHQLQIVILSLFS
jgi:hypothetical protein